MINTIALSSAICELTGGDASISTCIYQLPIPKYLVRNDTCINIRAVIWYSGTTSAKTFGLYLCDNANKRQLYKRSRAAANMTVDTAEIITTFDLLSNEIKTHLGDGGPAIFGQNAINMTSPFLIQSLNTSDEIRLEILASITNPVDFVRLTYLQVDIINVGMEY